ncbi:hypothetical protein [Mesorhizobium sp. M1403]|uniref:hypothetical protein n=1 Tax=Mesorhizobium sp. M1403 TaxID=2957097 RepID=UPI00333D0E19
MMVPWRFGRSALYGLIYGIFVAWFYATRDGFDEMRALPTPIFCVVLFVAIAAVRNWLVGAKKTGV